MQIFSALWCHLPLPFPITSTSDEQLVGVVRLPSSLFQEEMGPHQRVHDQKQYTKGGEW